MTSVDCPKLCTYNREISERKVIQIETLKTLMKAKWDPKKNSSNSPNDREKKKNRKTKYIN